MFLLKNSQFLQRLTIDSKPRTHRLLGKMVKKIKDILIAPNNYTFILKLFSMCLFPNFVYINVFLITTGGWINVYHKFLSNTHLKRNNSMQECKGGRAAWKWEDLEELQRGLAQLGNSPNISIVNPLNGRLVKLDILIYLGAMLIA